MNSTKLDKLARLQATRVGGKGGMRRKFKRSTPGKSSSQALDEVLKKVNSNPIQNVSGVYLECGEDSDGENLHFNFPSVKVVAKANTYVLKGTATKAMKEDSSDDDVDNNDHKDQDSSSEDLPPELVPDTQVNADTAPVEQENNAAESATAEAAPTEQVEAEEVADPAVEEPATEEPLTEDTDSPSTEVEEPSKGPADEQQEEKESKPKKTPVERKGNKWERKLKQMFKKGRVNMTRLSEFEQVRVQIKDNKFVTKEGAEIYRVSKDTYVFFGELELEKDQAALKAAQEFSGIDFSKVGGADDSDDEIPDLDGPFDQTSGDQTEPTTEAEFPPPTKTIEAGSDQIPEGVKFTEEDVAMVMDQTNADRKAAIAALIKFEGELVEAIMELS